MCSRVRNKKIRLKSIRLSIHASERCSRWWRRRVTRRIPHAIQNDTCFRRWCRHVHRVVRRGWWIDWPSHVRIERVRFDFGDISRTCGQRIVIHWTVKTIGIGREFRWRHDCARVRTTNRFRTKTQIEIYKQTNADRSYLICRQKWKNYIRRVRPHKLTNCSDQHHRAINTNEWQQCIRVSPIRFPIADQHTTLIGFSAMNVFCFYIRQITADTDHFVINSLDKYTSEKRCGCCPNRTKDIRIQRCLDQYRMKQFDLVIRASHGDRRSSEISMFSWAIDHCLRRIHFSYLWLSKRMGDRSWLIALDWLSTHHQMCFFYLRGRFSHLLRRKKGWGKRDEDVHVYSASFNYDQFSERSVWLTNDDR